MKCTVFTGCSYPAGIGLTDKSDSNDLWVNILYKSIKELSNTKLLNLAISGSTNQDIFQASIQAVINNDCKYLFVSWTELLRYKLNPATELYDTSLYWTTNSPLNDVNINPNINISANYQKNIRNRFFDLHHPHYLILKILTYSKILSDLCKKLGVTVFFLNSLITNWDNNYFKKIVTTTPKDTTIYTQKILNLVTRDDKEYLAIYNQIHQDYLITGGLECTWLNLYNSFRNDFYLDLGNDNIHPGIKSHRAYSDFLIEKLNNILKNDNYYS